MMTQKHSRERLHTVITTAATNVWGPERIEVLQSTLDEMVDQLVQVAEFPLAFEEEPTFFLR